jgi:hypothetical protein
MDKSLENVCIALDDLAKSLLTITTDDRTMTEIYGWNCPALTRHDISNIAKNISTRVKENDINIIDADLIKEISKIPLRINVFNANTFPQLLSTNFLNAMTSFMALIDWINHTLKPIFSWQILQDNKALPNQIAKRLRSIQIELDNLIPEKDNLKNQIKLINDATDAAESLPTDLESLKEARKKIDVISTDSAILFGKIDTYYKDADSNSNKILSKKKEADQLVEQCEEAYRITTTKGLAAAFDQRADKLSQTMWIWVVGLLLSLIAGGLIGASRFQALAKSLEAANPQWGVIWVDIVLSLIGLAAPIWFAWLATKQINQRFRLSEDYAFKASVAKAYEGYRREAARIDEAFEARLFSSALSRLEEAPLRLVDSDSHGSPWHEFFGSPAFQKAMNTVPELKDKLIEITKDSVGKLNGKVKSNGVTEEE